MNMHTETRTLRTGQTIPAIGFGTGVIRRYSRNPWLFMKARIRPILSSIRHVCLHPELVGDLCMSRIVDQAIQMNYRLFDCGRIYGYSEVMVGDGILRSGKRREDFFLVTKISDMDVTRSVSPNNVRGNLEDSLRYLKTSYVDAYLLHWPHRD